ncbi:uncharacterized protein LOC131949346 [Physella acuta]|uniref:uncharacterized protein LOC131949346 n=1 Tax=Physella acuta TaxID=109671 RepID=UPI0027DE033A|nr:uncharacterized protein LOC131949346 [Physella acuta]XP_059167194.1 uncharacterized protein LOC131949346 [Physella acuta]
MEGGLDLSDIGNSISNLLFATRTSEVKPTSPNYQLNFAVHCLPAIILLCLLYRFKVLQRLKDWFSNKKNQNQGSAGGNVPERCSDAPLLDRLTQRSSSHTTNGPNHSQHTNEPTFAVTTSLSEQIERVSNIKRSNTEPFRSSMSLQALPTKQAPEVFTSPASTMWSTIEGSSLHIVHSTKGELCLMGEKKEQKKENFTNRKTDNFLYLSMEKQAYSNERIKDQNQIKNVEQPITAMRSIFSKSQKRFASKDLFEKSGDESEFLLVDMFKATNSSLNREIPVVRNALVKPDDHDNTIVPCEKTKGTKKKETGNEYTSSRTTRTKKRTRKIKKKADMKSPVDKFHPETQDILNAERSFSPARSAFTHIQLQQGKIVTKIPSLRNGILQYEDINKMPLSRTNTKKTNKEKSSQHLESFSVELGAAGVYSKKDRVEELKKVIQDCVIAGCTNTRSLLEDNTKTSKMNGKESTHTNKIKVKDHSHQSDPNALFLKPKRLTTSRRDASYQNTKKKEEENVTENINKPSDTTMLNEVSETGSNGVLDYHKTLRYALEHKNVCHGGNMPRGVKRPYKSMGTLNLSRHEESIHMVESLLSLYQHDPVHALHDQREMTSLSLQKTFNEDYVVSTAERQNDLHFGTWEKGLLFTSRFSKIPLRCKDFQARKASQMAMLDEQKKNRENVSEISNLKCKIPTNKLSYLPPTYTLSSDTSVHKSCGIQHQAPELISKRQTADVFPKLSSFLNNIEKAEKKRQETVKAKSNIDNHTCHLLENDYIFKANASKSYTVYDEASPSSHFQAKGINQKDSINPSITLSSKEVTHSYIIGTGIKNSNVPPVTAGKILNHLISQPDSKDSTQVLKMQPSIDSSKREKEKKEKVEEVKNNVQREFTKYNLGLSNHKLCSSNKPDVAKNKVKRYNLVQKADVRRWKKGVLKNMKRDLDMQVSKKKGKPMPHPSEDKDVCTKDSTFEPYANVVSSQDIHDKEEIKHVQEKSKDQLLVDTESPRQLEQLETKSPPSEKNTKSRETNKYSSENLVPDLAKSSIRLPSFLHCAQQELCVSMESEGQENASSANVLLQDHLSSDESKMQQENSEETITHKKSPSKSVIEHNEFQRKIHCLSGTLRRNGGNNTIFARRVEVSPVQSKVSPASSNISPAKSIVSPTQSKINPSPSNPSPAPSNANRAQFKVSPVQYKFSLTPTKVITTPSTVNPVQSKSHTPSKASSEPSNVSHALPKVIPLLSQVSPVKSKQSHTHSIASPIRPNSYQKMQAVIYPRDATLLSNLELAACNSKEKQTSPAESNQWKLDSTTRPEVNKSLSFNITNIASDGNAMFTSLSNITSRDPAPLEVQISEGRESDFLMHCPSMREQNTAPHCPSMKEQNTAPHCPSMKEQNTAPHCTSMKEQNTAPHCTSMKEQNTTPHCPSMKEQNTTPHCPSMKEQNTAPHCPSMKEQNTTPHCPSMREQNTAPLVVSRTPSSDLLSLLEKAKAVLKSPKSRDIKKQMPTSKTIVQTPAQNYSAQTSNDSLSCKVGVLDSIKKSILSPPQEEINFDSASSRVIAKQSVNEDKSQIALVMSEKNEFGTNKLTDDASYTLQHKSQETNNVSISWKGTSKFQKRLQILIKKNKEMVNTSMAQTEKKMCQRNPFQSSTLLLRQKSFSNTEHMKSEKRLNWRQKSLDLAKLRLTGDVDSKSYDKPLTERQKIIKASISRLQKPSQSRRLEKSKSQAITTQSTAKEKTILPNVKPSTTRCDSGVSDQPNDQHLCKPTIANSSRVNISKKVTHQNDNKQCVKRKSNKQDKHSIKNCGESFLNCKEAKSTENDRIPEMVAVRMTDEKFHRKLKPCTKRNVFNCSKLIGPNSNSRFFQVENSLQELINRIKRHSKIQLRNVTETSHNLSSYPEDTAPSHNLSPCSVETAISHNISPCPVETAISHNMSPCPVETAISHNMSPCPGETAISHNISPCPEETAISHNISPCPVETAISHNLLCPEETAISHNISPCPVETAISHNISPCPEETAISHNMSPCPGETAISHNMSPCPGETAISHNLCPEETAVSHNMSPCPEETAISHNLLCPEETAISHNLLCPEETAISHNLLCPEETAISHNLSPCLKKCVQFNKCHPFIAQMHNKEELLTQAECKDPNNRILFNKQDKTLSGSKVTCMLSSTNRGYVHPGFSASDTQLVMTQTAYTDQPVSKKSRPVDRQVHVLAIKETCNHCEKARSQPDAVQSKTTFESNQILAQSSRNKETLDSCSIKRACILTGMAAKNNSVEDDSANETCTLTSSPKATRVKDLTDSNRKNTTGFSNCDVGENEPELVSNEKSFQHVSQSPISGYCTLESEPSFSLVVGDYKDRLKSSRQQVLVLKDWLVEACNRDDIKDTTKGPRGISAFSNEAVLHTGTDSSLSDDLAALFRVDPTNGDKHQMVNKDHAKSEDSSKSNCLSNDGCDIKLATSKQAIGPSDEFKRNIFKESNACLVNYFMNSSELQNSNKKATHVVTKDRDEILYPVLHSQEDYNRLKELNASDSLQNFLSIHDQTRPFPHVTNAPIVLAQSSTGHVSLSKHDVLILTSSVQTTIQVTSFTNGSSSRSNSHLTFDAEGKTSSEYSDQVVGACNLAADLPMSEQNLDTQETELNHNILPPFLIASTLPGTHQIYKPLKTWSVDQHQSHDHLTPLNSDLQLIHDCGNPLNSRQIKTNDSQISLFDQHQEQSHLNTVDKHVDASGKNEFDHDLESNCFKKESKHGAMNRLPWLQQNCVNTGITNGQGALIDMNQARETCQMASGCDSIKNDKGQLNTGISLKQYTKTPLTTLTNTALKRHATFIAGDSAITLDNGIDLPIATQRNTYVEDAKQQATLGDNEKKSKFQVNEENIQVENKVQQTKLKDTQQNSSLSCIQSKIKVENEQKKMHQEADQSNLRKENDISKSETQHIVEDTKSIKSVVHFDGTLSNEISQETLKHSKNTEARNGTSTSVKNCLETFSEYETSDDSLNCMKREQFRDIEIRRMSQNNPRIYKELKDSLMKTRHNLKQFHSGNLILNDKLKNRIQLKRAMSENVLDKQKIVDGGRSVEQEVKTEDLETILNTALTNIDLPKVKNQSVTNTLFPRKKSSFSKTFRKVRRIQSSVMDPSSNESQLHRENNGSFPNQLANTKSFYQDIHLGHSNTGGEKRLSKLEEYLQKIDDNGCFNPLFNKVSKSLSKPSTIATQSSEEEEKLQAVLEEGSHVIKNKSTRRRNPSIQSSILSKSSDQINIKSTSHISKKNVCKIQVQSSEAKPLNHKCFANSSCDLQSNALNEKLGEYSHREGLLLNVENLKQPKKTIIKKSPLTSLVLPETNDIKFSEHELYNDCIHLNFSKITKNATEKKDVDPDIRISDMFLSQSAIDKINAENDITLTGEVEKRIHTSLSSSSSSSIVLSWVGSDHLETEEIFLNFESTTPNYKVALIPCRHEQIDMINDKQYNDNTRSQTIKTDHLFKQENNLDGNTVNIELDKVTKHCHSSFNLKSTQVSSPARDQVHSCCKESVLFYPNKNHNKKFNMDTAKNIKQKLISTRENKERGADAGEAGANKSGSSHEYVSTFNMSGCGTPMEQQSYFDAFFKQPQWNQTFNIALTAEEGNLEQSMCLKNASVHSDHDCKCNIDQLRRNYTHTSLPTKSFDNPLISAGTISNIEPRSDKKVRRTQIRKRQKLFLHRSTLEKKSKGVTKIASEETKPEPSEGTLRGQPLCPETHKLASLINTKSNKGNLSLEQHLRSTSQSKKASLEIPVEKQKPDKDFNREPSQSNSSQASLNWYKPQSLPSSTSVHNNQTPARAQHDIINHQYVLSRIQELESNKSPETIHNFATTHPTQLRNEQRPINIDKATIKLRNEQQTLKLENMPHHLQDVPSTIDSQINASKEKNAITKSPVIPTQKVSLIVKMFEQKKVTI